MPSCFVVNRLRGSVWLTKLAKWASWVGSLSGFWVSVFVRICSLNDLIDAYLFVKDDNAWIQHSVKDRRSICWSLLSAFEFAPCANKSAAEV